MEIVVHFTTSASLTERNVQTTPSSRECPICLNNEELIQLPECLHAFCKDCIVEYINIKISDFKVLKIKCLQDGCECFIKENFIQTVLDKPTFEKYQRLVIQKINNKGAQTKICPQPGCSRPFIPSSGTSYTRCICNTLICNMCCEAWHDGKSCLEAIDPDFEIYAKENDVKLCIMCKTMVARVEGCTHITCPICDYEWCWLCGHEHTPFHEKKCSKEWNPLPPKKIILDWDLMSLSTKIKRVIVEMIIFILLLPFRIIFWPFYIFGTIDRIRLPNFSISEGMQAFIISFIVNIVYWGVCVYFVFLRYKDPGGSLALEIVLGILIFSPIVIKLVMVVWENKKKRKRWLKRRNDVFGYTNAHRPVENIKDDNANQHQKESREEQIPIDTKESYNDVN